jgi:hypothetical protein
MANPQVIQGVLNRLLTSVQVINYPELNVTSGFFGSRVATLSPEGEASDYIGTLTGAVPSPRPYQMMSVRFFLNKSQALSQLWENQRQNNTSIGDVNLTTDSPVLGPYYLQNCTLLNIEEIGLDGTTNDFPVMLRGTYQINAQLYGAAG